MLYVCFFIQQSQIYVTSTDGNDFNILATLVFPTIMRTIDTLQRGKRQPYHTSILSGEAWVQELLHGHLRRICTELGVEEPVFRELVIMLRNMGHNNWKSN